MAYLSFADATASAPGHMPTSRPQPEAIAGGGAKFTALEWSVVALAQRDRLSTLRSPGRMASALASLFGTRSAGQLADSRLEALRRMAVLVWHHGHRVADSAIRAFLAAGFTADQYALLAGSIATARDQRDRGTIR